MEPGLTWIPDSHGVRAAATRPICIVAGLECYYFQPITLLRWRMYEALRRGANGIGICPSGMLVARPETVTFLRGLYGEAEGLRPLMAGSEPAAAVQCDAPHVTLWERTCDGGARYVVAIRDGEPSAGPVEAAFFAPTPISVATAAVLFEGRTLPVGGGKWHDHFDEPYALHVYRLGR